MPFLRVATPFEPSANVTRRLRDKSAAFQEKLQLAWSIVNGQLNTCLPQQDEWLLEWLSERMVQENSMSISDNFTHNPRLSKSSWDLLLLLVLSCHSNGNKAVVNNLLRRHSFTKVLQDTFTELASVVDGDKECCFTSKDGTLELASLLTSIFKVVKVLESNSAGYIPLQPNNAKKRRRLDNHAPLLRGTAEGGVRILESFLIVLAFIIKISADNLVEESWIIGCINVFQSCVYGISNTAKLCDLLSSQVLLPYAIIMSYKSVPPLLEAMVADILDKHLFRPYLRSNSQRNQVGKQLAPLKTLFASENHGSSDIAIPKIFKIAVGPLLSKTSDDNYDSKTSEAYVSAVFGTLFPNISKQGLSESISNVLDLIASTGLSLNESTIKAIVSQSSTDLTEPNWKIIRRAVQSNIGRLISHMGGFLTLFDAQANGSEDCWIFVRELMIGYVRTRTLSDFLSQWHQRINGTPPPSINSLWYDAQLQKTVAEQIEMAFSAFQLSKLIPEYTNPNGSDIPIVLDTIVRGITRSETVEKLRTYQMPDIMYSHIINRPLEEQSWRHMRLLLQVINTWGAKIENEKLKQYAKLGIQSFRRVEQKELLVHEDCKRTLFVAKIVFASASKAYGQMDEVNRFKDEFSNFLHHAADRSGLEVWDGTIDSVRSVDSLATALSLSIVSKYIHLFTNPDQTFATSIFRAASSMPNDLLNGLNLGCIWDIMLHDSMNFEIIGYKDHIFHVLLKNCSISSTLEAPQLLTMISALKFPISSLGRSQREKILDNILAIFENLHSSMDNDLLVGSLEVIKKILDFQSTITRFQDGERSFGIDILFPNNSKTESTDVLRRKIDIGRRFLKSALTSSKRPPNKDYLELLLSSSRKDISNVDRSLSSDSADSSTAKAAIVVLEYWKLHNDSSNYSTSVVRKLRKELLKAISEIIIRNINTLPHRCSEAACYLDLYNDILSLDLGDGSDLQEATTLANYIRKKFLTEKVAEKSEIDFNNHIILAKAFQLQCKLRNDLEGALLTTLIFSGLAKTNSSPDPIKTAYEAQIVTIETSDYLSLFRFVSNNSVVDNSRPEESLEILKILISCYKDSTEHPVGSILSISASQLTTKLSKSTSAQMIVDICGCLTLILNEKPWAIYQLNIDEILAAVSATASYRGPRFSHTCADDIFIALCATLISILNLHRHRVQGRYHVLVSTIRNLMKCLFSPHTSAKRKNEQSIIPGWLDIETTGKENTCTVKSAIAFNRLLTTLCDPSASSVTKYKRKEKGLLSSSITSAKIAISVHVPQILKEFLQLQLNLHLSADSRAALSTGIYAMFDVMGKDILRSVNASIDGQSRILFKRLYDNWIKFGGWNEA